MAPVKLYGAIQSWNVARVVVCLEEAGVEYEVVPVNFATGEHKGPENTARNPFGQVPSFQDGDLCLFESRAICKYVCRKYKPELVKEKHVAEAALVDVWTEVEAHTYTSALSPILVQCLINPMMGGATNKDVVAEALAKFKKVLEVLEGRLSKSKYLAGDFISLADLTCVAPTLCLMATPCASVFDAYPHVKAWWGGLMSRPSAMKVAGLMKPQ